MAVLRLSWRREAFVVLGLVCVAPVVSLSAQEDLAVELRIDIVGATTDAPDDVVVPWNLPALNPAPRCIPVEANIVLVSRLEPCFSEPDLCDRTENFFTTPDGSSIPDVFGCADGADNDEDGLVDAEDPDCRGVQGWAFSVLADDCFQLESVSRTGTVTDLLLNPPGRRDLQSLQRARVVVPGLHDDQSGAEAACVLSLSNPVFLEVGEHVLLKLHGRLDTSALSEPGDVTELCGLTIVPPGQAGLAGTPTAVTIEGDAVSPLVRSATVAVQLGPEVRFLRGDTDGDGDVLLGDSVFLFDYLFLGGPRPFCLDAADINDDSGVALTDGIHLLNYLFLGGDLPPEPGPLVCGPDATEDALGCELAGVCPASEEELCEAPLPGEDLFFCEARDYPAISGGEVVALADFDLDGEVDIVIDGPVGGVEVWLGDGAGDFRFVQELARRDIPGVESLAAVDVNRDGAADVAAAGQGLAVFLNTDPGMLLNGGLVSQESFRSIAVGDLDSQGDAGNADLVAVTSDGLARLFFGFRGGDFVDGGTHDAGGQVFSSVAIGDLDGDDVLDFVTTNYQDRTSHARLFRNLGDGTFEEPRRLPVGRSPRGVRLGDLDADGRLDVVVAHRGDGRNDWVSAFLARGDDYEHRRWNVNAPLAGGCSGRCGGPTATALADFDGDGHLDFVLGTVFRNQLMLLRGRGDGRLELVSSTPSGSARHFDVADFDGDGDLDVASGNRGGLLTFTNCGVR